MPVHLVAGAITSEASLSMTDVRLKTQAVTGNTFVANLENPNLLYRQNRNKVK